MMKYALIQNVTSDSSVTNSFWESRPQCKKNNSYRYEHQMADTHIKLTLPRDSGVIVFSDPLVREQLTS